jgi:Flp pilus assembly protein TadD
MRMEKRRIYTLATLAAGIAGAVLVAGRSPKAAAADIRVPTDPNEIVETLASTSLTVADGGTPDPKRREVADLRRSLDAQPWNLRLALRLARLDIQLARENADPRFLGHAQAALAPWCTEQAPPPVLVLRATIEQSLHDFDAALRHLDLALATTPTPDDMQAWLTRAVILTVRGRYTEARASCSHVEGLAVVVCQTQIDSVTGHAKAAYDRLAHVLEETHASPAEEEWAISSLGEYAVRAGDAARAEALFKQALASSPTDAYVRGALADLLIDRGRFTEARALLEGREADDGMLLRLAIAERRGKLPRADEHIAMLGARFDASRARGDVVHRREEARFWLDLRDDPARALDLAKANWDVQKEPWDARIFLAAAKAAHEVPTTLIAWLDETKLEDPAIAELRRRP